MLDETKQLAEEGDMFDGETAFKLYDTYGFPLDLTQDALRNARHRRRYRRLHRRDGPAEGQGARGLGGLRRCRAARTVWFPLREKVGATEFLGYETESAEGVVRGTGEGRQEVESPQPARAAPSSSTRRHSMRNPAARWAIPA